MVAPQLPESESESESVSETESETESGPEAVVEIWDTAPKSEENRVSIFTQRN